LTGFPVNATVWWMMELFSKSNDLEEANEQQDDLSRRSQARNQHCTFGGDGKSRRRHSADYDSEYGS
jgi:hypothetical protein